MSRKPNGLVRGTRGIVWALCGCLVLGSVVTAGSRTKEKRVITRPKFDPSAERVALFDGLDQDVLSARVVAKDEFGGQVFVENKTDKPLTVELPESIVAVQVLPQMGMGGMGMGGMGGGMGGMGGGMMGGMGGGMGQAMGGGMGGMGMGGMGMGGGGGMGGMGMGGMGGMGGGGFFSIPAQAVVRVPFTSVCLEHGKANPQPRMKYKLVRPEVFTDKPAVQELLKLIAKGKLERRAAQAAAWHLASDMSWQELTSKEYKEAGSEPVPYFSGDELSGAQSIVAAAELKAAEAAEKASEQPNQQPVVRDRVTGQVTSK